MKMRGDGVDYNEEVEKSFIAKKSGEGLVEIEVTFPGGGCGPDTSALVVNGVIDSGASRSLVSSELVKRLRKLNAGSISAAGELQQMEVTLGDDTKFHEGLRPWDVEFFLTDSQPLQAHLLEWPRLKYTIVLGSDWLWEHEASLQYRSDGSTEGGDLDAETAAMETLHVNLLPVSECNPDSALADGDAEYEKGGGGMAEIGRMPESLNHPLQEGLAKIKSLGEYETSERQLMLNRLAEPHVKALEKKFEKTLFSEPDYGGNRTPLVNGEPYEHDIELKEGSRPHHARAVKQGGKMTDAMVRTIRKMEESGVAYECQSDWAAMAFMRKKKEPGEYRLVANYKPLNACTKLWPVEMPTVQDCIEAQARATIRTSLDLRSAFTQIKCSKRAEAYTAISTVLGTFCMRQMGQGLSGAPFSLQRVITSNFRDEVYGTADGKEQGFLAVFFDDLVIFTDGDPEDQEALADHFDKVGRVLTKLEYLGFTLALHKAKWYQEYILYLGFILGPHGDLMMDRDKVMEILEMPIPKTKKQLRSFLGKLQYQRAFIKGISLMTAPLTDMVGEKSDFKWPGTGEVEKAWWDLKLALVQAPTLYVPLGKGPFWMYTDASDTHIGGVLMEARPLPEEPDRRVICGYFSRKLSGSQRRWSVTYKEQFALVEGLEQWERLFRYATDTTVYTDNSSIVYLQTKKFPIDNRHKEHRLLERLNGFDCQVKHIPGKDNTLADAWSRPPGSEDNVFRIIDLCAGSGTLLLALEELMANDGLIKSNSILYTPVDYNPWSKKVIAKTYQRIYEEHPGHFGHRPPDNLFRLGDKVDEEFPRKLGGVHADLIFGGLDPRDFSSAQGSKAPGLAGKHSLFEIAWKAVHKLRERNLNVKFCFECVCFGMEFEGTSYTPHLRDDWETVRKWFGEFAGFQWTVKNMGNHFLPQHRVRLFLFNFNIKRPWPVRQMSFQDVVGDVGLVPEGKELASTITASGKASVRKKQLNWITVGSEGKEVKQDLGFNVEEALQGLPRDHTALPNIPDTERRKLVGYAWMTPCVTFLLKEAMRRANILDLEDERIQEPEEPKVAMNMLRSNLETLNNLRNRIREVFHCDPDYRRRYEQIVNGGEDGLGIGEENAGCKIRHRNAEGKGIIVDKDGRWTIPDGDSTELRAIRQELLALFHDETHNGVARDLSYMKQFVQWKKMREDLKLYIDTCKVCKLAKASTTKGLRGKLRPLPIPEGPGRRVNMDFIAMPVCNASWGGRTQAYRGIFAVVDSFSRFCVLVPYAGSVTAETVADMYTCYSLPVFGFVDTIVSDRDPRFSSRVWTAMIKRHGTQATKTTSYRPNSDGLVERRFRELLTKLRIELVNRSSVDGRPALWPELLPWAEMVLNTTVCTSTGSTPWFLQHGREFRKPLELFFKPTEESDSGVVVHEDNLERSMREAVERATIALEKSNTAMEARRPENPRQESISVGDMVFVKGFHRGVEEKTRARQVGPFRVIDKVDSQVYKVERDSPRQQNVINADRLVKFKDSQELRDLFPAPRWSPPQAGPVDCVLGPYLIEEVNFSRVPPKYLIRRTEGATHAVWHEEDEVTALYANAEEAPGAIRQFVLEYLSRRRRNRLPESGVPNRTEDPEGHRRYEDHVLLLYDRREDALGPQYYRRSSAEGPGPWTLTAECALRADYLREQAGVAAVDRISEEQDDEMIIAPLDDYNLEVKPGEPGEEGEEDTPHPPANPEHLARYQNAFEEERLAIQNQPVDRPSVEVPDELRRSLVEAKRRRDKETRRNQRAREKTYTAEAKRKHTIRELGYMYDRARLLEPLSESDSSDSNLSDSSDGDTSSEEEEPAEEISPPGETLAPQAEGNDDSSDGESSSGESEEVNSDLNDRSDEEENTSESNDGSEEEEESSEEEVWPRRSARIAARNANHAQVLLLLRMRDSVQNMW